MKLAQALSTSLLSALPIVKQKKFFLFRLVNPYIALGGLGSFALYKAYQNGAFDSFIKRFGGGPVSASAPTEA